MAAHFVGHTTIKHGGRRIHIPQVTYEMRCESVPQVPVFSVPNLLLFFFSFFFRIMTNTAYISFSFPGIFSCNTTNRMRPDFTPYESKACSPDYLSNVPITEKKNLGT